MNIKNVNINKNTAGVIAAIILLVGGGLYYFFRDTPEPPPPAPAAEQKPASAGDIQFLGTGLTETKDGKLQWEVNADQMQAAADSKVVNMTGLRGKIYEDGGQGTIQITANQGNMDTTEKILTLEGNIKAISERGAEFAGNMVKWFIKERRFTGQGDIRYHQKDITITGENLEVDQNSNIISVTGNARAELRR